MYRTCATRVRTDVARMEELGLIERADGGEVMVPYESMEILLPLARAVA
jgi:predicted transcriptional regulator